MASTDGSRDSAPKAAAMRGKTSELESKEHLVADAPLANSVDELDEDLRDGAQTDEEPDTMVLLGDEVSSGADDPETEDFIDHDDPDVAAVDKALSSSRKQKAADNNSSIRRLLEERSEARRLKQDLDYLDFDD